MRLSKSRSGISVKAVMLVFILAFIITFQTSQSIVQPIKAAEKFSVVFKDDFTGGLNAWENPSSDKIALSEGKGVLQINNFGFMEVVNYQKGYDDTIKTPLPDNYTLTVDVGEQTADWFDIVSGIPDPDKSAGTATALIFINDQNQLLNFHKQSQKDAAYTQILRDGESFKTGWMSIKIEYAKGTGDTDEAVLDSSTAKIYLKKQNDPDASYTLRATVSGVMIGGWAGLGAMGQSVSFDNFCITAANGTVIVNEDFEKTAVGYYYFQDFKKDVTFRYWGNSRDKVLSGKKQYLAFSEAKNDSVVCKTEIVKDADCYNVFNMSFSLILDAATLKAGENFALNFAHGTAKAKSLQFINENEKISVSDGTDKVSLGVAKIPAADFVGANIRISGRYDGGLTVYNENVKAAEFKNYEFVGKFSFGSKAIDGAVNAKITDFILTGITYSKTGTGFGGDQHADFSLLKENIVTGVEQMGGFNSFWKASGGVNGYSNNDSGTPDGRLSLDGVSQFGPASKYADFIFKFDVTYLSVNAGEGTWFGLSLGKNNWSANFMENPVFIFNQIENNTCLDLITQMKLSSGYSTTLSEKNNFLKQSKDWTVSDGMTFIFIAKNRTLSVYFKNFGDSEMELDTPKLVFENVNTSGYFCIVSGSSVVMDIDNVSVINLAE